MLIKKEKNITFHYYNLVQNKIAYVNLAKLDPKNPSFDSQKSSLIEIIKKTNKDDLENPINNREKEILVRQNSILQKVFATKSYEEGLEILRSPESIANLTDQTKLIEDLESQIEKLKESPLLRLDWPLARSK